VKEIIKLKNITKVYTVGKVNIPALKDMSLTIKEGELLSIMGPSGSGKTTLLNILGCLDKPNDGKYFMEEREISLLSDDALSGIRSRKIGFIFQSYNLIPQITVLENIGLPLFYQELDEKFIREESLKLAKLVGLEDRTSHKPTELSGGQQQRVAIARALINKPVIILADEPTGNLDSSTGKEIMELLAEFNKKGKTLITVTHDLNVASYSKRIVKMLDGEIINDN